MDKNKDVLLLNLNTSANRITKMFIERAQLTFDKDRTMSFTWDGHLTVLDQTYYIRKILDLEKVRIPEAIKAHMEMLYEYKKLTEENTDGN